VLAATEADLTSEIAPLAREATELIAILTTIIRKARSNISRGNAI
jgi:hypothetical protein